MKFPIHMNVCISFNCLHQRPSTRFFPLIENLNIVTDHKITPFALPILTIAPAFSLHPSHFSHSHAIPLGIWNRSVSGHLFMYSFWSAYRTNVLNFNTLTESPRTCKHATWNMVSMLYKSISQTLCYLWKDTNYWNNC